MFEKIFGAIGIIGKIIKWILLVVFLGLGIFLLIFPIIALTRGDGWSGLNDHEKVGAIFALVIGVILLYLAAWLIKSLIFSNLRFRRNVKKYSQNQSKIPNDNDLFSESDIGKEIQFKLFDFYLPWEFGTSKLYNANASIESQSKMIIVYGKVSMDYIGSDSDDLNFVKECEENLKNEWKEIIKKTVQDVLEAYLTKVGTSKEMANNRTIDTSNIKFN